MSSQDKLESVLREIHVLISKSQASDETGEKIIVEKKKIIGQLEKLNTCVYEMMDEYEVTKQSREQANREAKKQGEQIINKANKNAEEVYAAAVLYTDEALQRIRMTIEDSVNQVNKVLEKTKESLNEHKDEVKSNQYELKEQLHSMADTKKYLSIIEERNKELEKKKKEKEGEKNTKTKEHKPSIYDDRKTEIKVNPEYFQRKAQMEKDK